MQYDKHIEQFLAKAMSDVMNKGRVWNMTVQVYTRATSITVVRNCFAFMFTNIGDSPAYVNGMVVFPASVPNALGDSRSVSGHWMDLYKGKIDLSFSPVLVNPRCEVVQLYYHDHQSNLLPL
jgi:hypothetical protein